MIAVALAGCGAQDPPSIDALPTIGEQAAAPRDREAALRQVLRETAPAGAAGPLKPLSAEELREIAPPDPPGDGS